MPAPQEIRQHHHVVLGPVKALAADFRIAIAFHDDNERVCGFAFELQRFARAQELRAVIVGGIYRSARYRIDELHRDTFKRIAFFVAQSM